MSVYGSSATRDRQGWFLGLTGAQITLVLVAAAPAWIAMAVGHWVYLTVLVPGWMVIVVLVCLPIRGWSALQWLGVLLRHLVGTTLGWSRFQSAAAAGHPLDANRSSANQRSANHGEPSRGRGGPDAHGDMGGVEADLPGVLAGIRVHDGPPMTSRLLRPAIIQNQATRTWAVTARIVHPGIALSDNTDRTRMGAGLAELFEAATGANQIHLIAFQVRTIPDDGAERDEWVRRHTGRGDTPRDADGESELSAHVNAQLELMTAGAAMRREAFVTVVVRETVIAREAKRAGGGAAGRARILYGLMAEVESRLTGAIGCTHVTWLDTAALAVAIRTGFEPGDSPALADAAIAHAHDERVAVGVPLAAAGPVNAVPRMRCYQHGEWESTSSAILLPRKGAMIGALARALVPSQPGERRALTVFYRPVSQQTADRATGRAEMSAAMGAEMRRQDRPRRTGQGPTRRRPTPRPRRDPRNRSLPGSRDSRRLRHRTHHDHTPPLGTGWDTDRGDVAYQCAARAARGSGHRRRRARPPARRLDPALRIRPPAPRRCPRRSLRSRRDSPRRSTTRPPPIGGRPAPPVLTTGDDLATSRSNQPEQRGPGPPPHRAADIRREQGDNEHMARTQHEHGARTIDGLLADFGAPLPRTPPPPLMQRADRLFPRSASPRGVRRPGHGWAATVPRLPGYLVTSDQTPVVWPLITGDGLPPWGAEMGYDATSGGKFYCDPLGWVLDDSIPVTNPNVFIFGKPGRGKSAMVKAFMLRMLRYGYRSLVLGDVKDEYEDLARVLGVEPFRIGPGLSGRINPLDLGPLAHDWEHQPAAEQHRRSTVTFTRWLFLIRGLVGSQGVAFTPTEERVVNKVLRHLTGWTDGASRLAPLTIPQVWAALDNPDQTLTADCRYATRQDFFDGTRALRDALGALCEGSLQGMFDTESTYRPDWRAPIQTLSLKTLLRHRQQDRRRYRVDVPELLGTRHPGDHVAARSRGRARGRARPSHRPARRGLAPDPAQLGRRQHPRLQPAAVPQ